MAAKLLEPMGDKADPRWFETLNAVSQHDHGWQEWQSLTALNPEGEPRNFLDTPPEESEEQARRAVDCALHQSLWGGLLVARHVHTLYRKNKEESLRRLLTELEAARTEWRAILGIDLQQEKESYQFLNWADTLSLLLCLQPNERLGPVHPHLHGQSYTLKGKGSTRYLTPWPYSQDELTLSVEARHLERERFGSEKELAEALGASKIVTKQWVLLPYNG